MAVPGDLVEAEAAVRRIWEQMPLQAARAIFVLAEVPLFGAFEPRPDNRFTIGETLLTYIEPVGYTWTAADQDMLAFGVSLDFALLTPAGEILGGQKNFLSYKAQSRARVRELMLNASLDVTGITEGDYVLQYTLRCLNSAKAVEIELPFQIVGQ